MTSYDVTDAVATITLDRPEAMNSLTAEVKAGLLESLEFAADDPEVRAVLHAVRHPVRRMALTTIYALGLRLGEGLSLETVPVVFQWNKRDLPDVVPVEEMAEKLNKIGAPAFEAVAVTGEGVFATLKKLAQTTRQGTAASADTRTSWSRSR